MKKYFYKIGYKILQVYWFIFRPKFIGVRCLVENEEGDEVLLVRHTYVLTDYWSAPGGKIDKGESFNETAKREVLEELNINIFEVREVGEYITKAEYKTDIVSLCVAKTKDKDFKIDESEILEAKWFKKDNLPNNIFIATKNLLSISTQIKKQ